MPDNHSPESDSPNAPTPGIGRVHIPVPSELFEEDDAILMHDDLEAMVGDAQAVCLSLGTLVALLRRAGDAEGMAELLDSVRLRAELVFEGVQDVQRTVLAWGNVPGGVA